VYMTGDFVSCDKQVERILRGSITVGNEKVLCEPIIAPVRDERASYYPGEPIEVTNACNGNSLREATTGSMRAGLRQLTGSC
jgi:hypothetical protein